MAGFETERSGIRREGLASVVELILTARSSAVSLLRACLRPNRVDYRVRCQKGTTNKSTLAASWISAVVGRRSDTLPKRSATHASRSRRPGRAGNTIVSRCCSGHASIVANRRPTSASERSWAARVSSCTPDGRCQQKRLRTACLGERPQRSSLFWSLSGSQLGQPWRDFCSSSMRPPTRSACQVRFWSPRWWAWPSS